MADTPNGETVTPGDSQTTVQTPAATPAQTPPVANAGDPAEVERLRKEAAQATMRANQLQKEKEARDKADEDARQKQLEEDNNYKELLEQEKAKRESLETEKETREREAALTEAKQKVLGEFSDDVKKTAEELGIGLTDTEEASVEAFKGKLEKLSQTVSSEARVTPNNPGQAGGKSELTPDELKEGLRDANSFHDIVTGRFPGIKAMTKPTKPV